MSSKNKGMSRMCDGYSESHDPRSILPTLSRSLLARIILERLDEGDEELAKLICSVSVEKKDKRTPQAIVTRLMNRYDHYEYGLIEDPYGFALDLRRLSDRAAEAASSGNYSFAVGLLTGLIENAGPHAYEGDDEDCEIMESVEGCFECLAEIAQEPDAGAGALRELRKWAFQGVDAQWARDGDSWDMSCLELVALAARDGEDERAVLAACSRFTEGKLSEWSAEYRAERASAIAAALLARRGDGAALRGYIDAHLDLADIRRLAVDDAMSARDYDRAIELCRDGVASFRKRDQNGTADDFAERLIKALDVAGKKDAATMEAESLLIESFSRERFQFLKKRYSKRESWITARDRIIKALGKKDSTYNLAEVYKAERMYDRLLSLAEDDEFLFRENIATIGRAYPERAAGFIKRDVERKLKNTASRDSYARCAESILTYGTYAGKKAAEALFDSLIVNYPARRAMREEFERARQKEK